MNNPVIIIVLTVLPLLGYCHAAELPKYQAIVYPEVFDGRDEGTRALKVTDDITLNLEPSSILHENFFLRTYRQGIAQHRYFNIETLQRGLYHDKRRYAAVVLSEDGNNLQVEGVVGPNLKIRPIEMKERSENGRQAHLLETIEDSDSDNVHGVFPEGKLSVLERADKKRTGFDASAYSITLVTPELFFIMDSRLRAGFNSTEAAMKYLMISFVVVNLRYRTVSNPKVQLILRGVEFSEHKQEAEYYSFLGNGGIDGLKSLYGIVDFVKKKNDTYGKFDMVYFSTGYDMYAVSGATYQQSLAGFAFVASACIDTREQLGEDTAYSYRMIRIAAHEVAHTLGCPHDGTSIEGHIKVFRPDAGNCPWDQGYIMSYLEENGNSMKFSSCCNYQMSLLSWTYEAECLRRNDSVTTIAKQWSRKYKLPGELLSKNRQCRMTYPDLVKTYYMPKLKITNCVAQCFVPGHQFQGADGNWPVILIDGTTCSKNPRRICINGDCIPDGRTQRPKN